MYVFCYSPVDLPPPVATTELAGTFSGTLFLLLLFSSCAGNKTLEVQRIKASSPLPELLDDLLCYCSAPVTKI